MRDDELLERARAGDETAFALLYERHRDVIFRFAYRMTLDVGIAEDLVHDTFLSLIRDSGRFDPTRASLRTYLSATIRNLALTQRRRRPPNTSSEDMAEWAPATRATNPLHVLLIDELADHVQRALTALPTLQREAVVLFECEELSLAETAAIVGADVGTVKARLHRARERLRRALAPYLDQADRLGTARAVPSGTPRRRVEP
jgi:RNA polymerase sigma-70 factor (ECF subfamily)